MIFLAGMWCHIYTSINSMIDSILTAIQQPFFLRSLGVVILLAFIFPLYGNIIIVRQEANIAHTFAYIALLGVAVWIWFDRPLLWPIFGSVLLTVLFLHLLWSQDDRSHVSHNEIWAQLWLVGAILLVSQMSGYRADISSYLFGDILLLWTQDIRVIASLVVITLILYVLFGKKRYALSLNQSLAISKNIPTTFLSLLYLIAIWLLIWWAMKIIWVLLVSAFLILPSNIWKLIAVNKAQRNLISVITGLVTSILALFLSRYRDMPSWASIVGVMIITYIVVMLGTGMVSKLPLKRTNNVGWPKDTLSPEDPCDTCFLKEECEKLET